VSPRICPELLPDGVDIGGVLFVGEIRSTDLYYAGWNTSEVLWRMTLSGTSFFVFGCEQNLIVDKEISCHLGKLAVSHLLAPSCSSAAGACSTRLSGRESGRPPVWGTAPVPWIRMRLCLGERPVDSRPTHLLRPSWIVIAAGSVIRRGKGEAALPAASVASLLNCSRAKK